MDKLESAVETILKTHRVGGLLDISYTKEVEKRTVRAYKNWRYIKKLWMRKNKERIL